jgi:hypothetical protein
MRGSCRAVKVDLDKTNCGKRAIAWIRAVLKQYGARK